MTQAVLYALALAAGIVLTVQVGVNAVARKFLASSAEAAALLSFVVGTFALIAYMSATRTPWPARTSFTALPLWAWTGGLLGAFYVVTTTLVGPRLGAAASLCLVVLGQLLAALLVDHFGWLGFPQHSISLVRVAGVALLLAGVVLITR